jgi:hypothetical protein
MKGLLWVTLAGLSPGRAPAGDGGVTGGVFWAAGREPGPLEKGAYLGVSAVSVDEALGSQLGLPAGVGLRIEYVDPESPANGKLQLHDVLHKLDDQLLVNQPQLAALIRSHQAGETVNLAILRAGKSQSVAVTLAEKELPPLRALDQDRPQIHISPPRWLAPNYRDRGGKSDPETDWPNLMKEMEEALRKSTLAPEEIERLLENLRKHLPRTEGHLFRATPALPAAPEEGAAGAGASVGAGSSAGAGSSVGVAVGTAVVADDGVNLYQNLTVDRRGVTLTVDNRGNRRLAITDGGKGTVFEGPIDTDEQRRAVPAEYRDLLEQLERARTDRPMSRSVIITDGPSAVAVPAALPPPPHVY